MKNKQAQPKKKKKMSKIVGIPLAVVLIIGAILVYFYHPYFSPQFSKGISSEFQGVYFSDPQPLIILDPAFLPEGNDSEALLITSEGQNLTEKMAEWKINHGIFEGKRIRVQGTMFQTDGKVIIELNNNEQTLLNIERYLTYPMQQTPSKNGTLTGEIISPKCWFGTVQKNKRKVYENCTKKEIKNGQPAIVKVLKNDKNILYLLKSHDSNKVDFSRFVGQTVEISGDIFYQNGWNVISTQENQIHAIKHKF